MNKNDPTMNTRNIVVSFKKFIFQKTTASTPSTRELITLR